jgi:hypothetical protein
MTASIREVTPSLLTGRELPDRDEPGIVGRVAGDDAEMVNVGVFRRESLQHEVPYVVQRHRIARGGYVKSRVLFADEQTAIAAGYRPCAAWSSREVRAIEGTKAAG